MAQFSRCWAATVIRFRLPLLIGLALAVAVAPLSFNRLYHDDSNESYFLQGDPNLEAFNALIDHFGDNEYLTIGIPALPDHEDVFHPRTIAIIDELTQFLETHEVVTQVRSLSKYEYTHSSGGMLATDNLFEDPSDLAQTPETLDEARAIIQGEALAMESLVTRDLKHTVIVARTEYIPKANAHKVKVVHDLLDFIEAQNYEAEGYSLHLSGIPVISERFETLTQSDMAWINPTMAVIIVAILFLIFRSLVATLLPLLFIGVVSLLIISLQGWLRWPFTAVNSALIPMAIILSVGTCVHVLVDFFHLREQGLTPKASAERAVQHLLFPVFFTCLTTAIGFVALAVTDLLPVQQFAVLAAVTSLLIFLLGMTVLPATLSYVPWIAKGSLKARNDQPGRLPRFLQWLPHWTFKKRHILAVVGIAVSLFSLYSVRFIEVDTNIINYFKRDSWVRQDLLYLNAHFKGVSNLEVVIDTGKPGGVKDPHLLQRADALEAYLDQLPESGKPISLIKFYKQINQSLHQDARDHFTLPTTQPMAAQFLLLYENTGPEEDLSDLKDFDERYLRIAVPFANMNASLLEARLCDIRTHLNQAFGDLNWELTGALVMNNALDSYVNNGMAKSFGLAIAIIGLCFLVLFRSLKYGLIALIPSIMPVLLTGGLISLAGISMDLGTMIVGAMTIGIAVDDSIHLMSRYILHRKQSENVYEALQSAMASTGKAVILTSIILVSGFSVMLLGAFVSYIYVGLFSAMIMAFALIGDLLFLPALLFLFDRNTPHSTETSPSIKATQQEDPPHAV